MPHFAQGLGLNLSNSFSGDSELTPNLFKCAAVSIHKSKSLLEHLSFTFSQRFEDVLDLLLQENNRGHIAWIFGALVFDKVAKIRLLAFSDRRLQRNGLLRHFQNSTDPINWQQDFLSD